MSTEIAKRTFLVVCALLFAASVGVTILWCNSMSAMGGMPMPGGWTMSMAWMRMPGQSWPSAAAMFLGMWDVMMVAMMFPSLVPMLQNYREAVGGSDRSHLGWRTTVVGLGYFFVWTLFGIVVYPIGVMLAAIEMQEPTLAHMLPFAIGIVFVAGGLFQLSSWKVCHLTCCRESPGHGQTLSADAGTAWRHGLKLGLHCGQCCAGLIAILLVIGVMDLRVMAAITVAITLERLLPKGERVARAVGIVMILAGLFLLSRAAGFKLA